MGTGARLQRDSKVKIEVGVQIESNSDVKMEANLKTQSGGGREAKAKALFYTLKEQASVKVGRETRLGNISETRTFAQSLPFPGGRNGS